MVRPAMFVTFLLLAGVGYVLLDALGFLRPYAPLIRARYIPEVALYVLLLAVNLFAATLLLARKLGLRTTGAKLAHLEKEGLAGDALAREIVPDEGADE